MPQRTNESSINFLEENPLNSNLAFGHDKIVSAIKKIVEISPEAFSLALDGSWGSGKSSIIDSLKKELLKVKIPVVVFDVWKYEGDGLRRTFIRVVHDQMTNKTNGYSKLFDKNHKLSKNLSNSSQVYSEAYRLFSERVKNHLIAWFILGLVILLPFVVFVLTFDTFLGWIDITTPLGSILPVLFSGGLASFVFKYFTNFIDTRKIVTNKERFEDPIEFELEFERLLAQGFKSKKAVFVFDNLDRVKAEKALQILTTIKTFLGRADMKADNIKITFIIPCDISALKAHLNKPVHDPSSKTEFSGINDPDEFIRKFFNSTLAIPEFYISELEDWTRTKLSETGIEVLKDNYQLSFLLIKAFNKNPRQIIQFINTLVSNYILISEREISSSYLKQNFNSLAKYLLIKEKFYDEIQFIEIGNYVYFDDAIKGLENASKMNSKFRSFIKETAHIKINDIQIFKRLRKSKYEQEFDTIDRLISLIESNQFYEILNNTKNDSERDINEDLEYIKTLRIDQKQNEFEQVVRLRLQTLNPILFMQVLENIFHLTKYLKLTFSDHLFEDLHHKLELHSSYLYLTTPELIRTEYLLKFNSIHYKQQATDLIKNKWVSLFFNFYHSKKDDKIYSEDYVVQILKSIINSISAYSIQELNDVRVYLEDPLFHLDLEISELLLTSDETVEKLVTEELGTRLLNLEVESIELASITMKIPFEKFNGEQFNESLLALHNKYFQQIDSVDKRDNWLPTFISVINNLKHESDLVKSSLQIMGEAFKKEAYKNSLFTFGYLYHVYIKCPTFKPYLDQLFSDFINKVSVTYFKKVIESCPSEIRAFTENRNADNFINSNLIKRASNDLDFFNVIHHNQGSDFTQLVLNFQISHNQYENLFKTFEALNFKFEHNVSIASEIIKIASTQPDIQKSTLLSIIGRLRLPKNFDYSEVERMLIQLMNGNNHQIVSWEKVVESFSVDHQDIVNLWILNSIEFHLNNYNVNRNQQLNTLSKYLKRDFKTDISNININNWANVIVNNYLVDLLKNLSLNLNQKILGNITNTMIQAIRVKLSNINNDQDKIKILWLVKDTIIGMTQKEVGLEKDALDEILNFYSMPSEGEFNQLSLIFNILEEKGYRNSKFKSKIGFNK